MYWKKLRSEELKWLNLFNNLKELEIRYKANSVNCKEAATRKRSWTSSGEKNPRFTRRLTTDFSNFRRSFEGGKSGSHLKKMTRGWWGPSLICMCVTQVSVRAHTQVLKMGLAQLSATKKNPSQLLPNHYHQLKKLFCHGSGSLLSQPSYMHGRVPDPTYHECQNSRHPFPSTIGLVDSHQPQNPEHPTGTRSIQPTCPSTGSAKNESIDLYSHHPIVTGVWPPGVG